MSEKSESRRDVLKGLAIGTVVGGAGFASSVTLASQPETRPEKKVHYRGSKPSKTPLFSGAVSYGNLLFVAGKGAHFDGDIRAHTAHVLDEIEKELENAGSSMQQVLKVQVFLNDLADYRAMNEVFLGRFGSEPPVRTTVACAGGIPGDSLVEMDVIAYI
jgi:enamine deaminase RidA (YjgF/YER057c/UK114 family)